MHLADVGGSVQGSFCITAADAWMDPPSFPPIRLVEDGVLRDDVEQLFARQSRVPPAVKMDLRAAIAGVGGTLARLQDARRSVRRADGQGGDALDDRRRRAADAIAAVESIPDGRWSHRAFTEAALPGDPGVYAYQVNVTKQGARLIVDNVGTDPQAGSINVTYAAFAGAVQAAVVLTAGRRPRRRVRRRAPGDRDPPRAGAALVRRPPGGGQPVGRVHERDAPQLHRDRDREDALVRG